MSEHASDNGFCLFCGYALRGLPSGICPECGRAFDPRNPKTFDHAARKTLRRRRVRLAVLLCAAGLVLYAVGPHGLREAVVTFHCRQCGGDLVFTRQQLKPSPWLPVRWPGWTTQEFQPELAAAGAPTRPCANMAHEFDQVSVMCGTRDSKVGMSVGFDPGVASAEFSGRRLTPDTAEWALRFILGPEADAMGYSLSRMPVGQANPGSAGAPAVADEAVGD